MFMATTRPSIFAELTPLSAERTAALELTEVPERHQLLLLGRDRLERPVESFEQMYM